MKKSTLIKKSIVFSVIFSIGILFLYSINFIWVISVLILLGISLGISGIPSERFAPYPADVAVSFGQKIKELFKL
ncbi:hypothetical protein [Nitrosarchaeum sp. AC2]|uniref:hypothetical protein n=1 Tax=Nitrosarchaeum sp. AC2 TaxID=2259673 RepID=UPI0015CA45D0|nr:hypothetical protein [Nitrosarchaeum sp. AC2]